jgi:hypothetical protein
MSHCAVIIPLYKGHHSDEEKASLIQTFKVLKNHAIIIVGPKNKSLKSMICSSIKGFGDFTYVPFKDNYFNGIKSYNRLMLSTLFYNKFKKFDYILICQADAYVFEDKLLEWCNLGYDYIGAPWFKPSIEEPDLHKAFLGVGNGGLSLRKTSSMLKVLNTFKYVYSWKECIQFLKSKKDIGTIKKILSLIKSFTVSNNFHHLFNNFGNNEDYFWGIYVTKSFAWYKTPDMTTALQFSFEKRVAESYELNNKSLPMGCHKWWNDDVIDFWKVHIPFPKDAKQENAE